MQSNIHQVISLKNYILTDFNNQSTFPSGVWGKAVVTVGAGVSADRQTLTLTQSESLPPSHPLSSGPEAWAGGGRRSSPACSQQDKNKAGVRLEILRANSENAFFGLNKATLL